MMPTSLLAADLTPLICSGYRFQSCVLVKCELLQNLFFFRFIEIDYIVNLIFCDITAYKTCLIDYCLAITSPTSLTLTHSPSQSLSLNPYQQRKHFGLVWFGKKAFHPFHNRNLTTSRPCLFICRHEPYFQINFLPLETSLLAVHSSLFNVTITNTDASRVQRPS